MATPIKYQPPVAQTHELARDQLEQLLDVLAESGTLRLLKDFVQRMGPGEVFSARLDTVPGRNALGNLALLATAVTRIVPDRLKRAMDAVLKAVEHARQPPPGALSLLFSLRRANVRQTMFVLISLLDALGAELQPDASSMMTRR